MTASLLCQVVPFVHPAIAGIAVLTGLIPILVHLINRRRYARVRWAAMSFLLAANRRSARRVRLEQWLLLLMRVAVIVLFGLALARPYIPALPFVPFASSRSHRVLLIDNTLSMNARTSSGQTRFELAKACAQGLVASFPKTDAVSIVTLAAPAEAVISHAAYDRRFVRERLSAIEPTQRAGDTVQAIDAALEILNLSQVPADNRSIYLVSDLPRREWLSAGAPGPADTTAAIVALRKLAGALSDAAVDLNVIRVGPGPIGNIAVTRLDLQSPLVGVNLPVRIVVEVTNFGPSSERDLTLQIRRDGEIIRRRPLPTIEPGGSAAATVSIGFSSPGVYVLEAKVSGATDDALSDDDARFLSFEVRDAMPVLLVDGRPGASPLTGQAGFLATALAPKSPTDSPLPRWEGGKKGVVPTTLIEPKVITDAELDGEALGDYDVVALCNVQRLSAEQWKQLEKSVSLGGGLFIFAGDLVSTDNYNRFGYADGAGVLPGKIGPVVDLSPDADTSTGFASEDLTHEIVADFRDQPSSGLFLALVDRYLPVEPDARRAEIVLRYGDGGPALVVADFGRGRVLMSTTTANMDWTNLPAKGDYVSLMLNAFAYLSPRHGDHRNVMVGQSVQEPLTPLESSLPIRVTTSRGATTEGRLVPVGDTLALEYGPVKRAGALSASIGSKAVRFTANTDPAESDLAVVDEWAFVEALDRPVHMVSDAAAVAGEPAAAKTSELASLVFYLVIALLMGEMCMALWFGSLRSGGTVKR